VTVCRVVGSGPDVFDVKASRLGVAGRKYMCRSEAATGSRVGAIGCTTLSADNTACRGGVVGFEVISRVGVFGR
jgi:hypothetical protein